MEPFIIRETDVQTLPVKRRKLAKHLIHLLERVMSEPGCNYIRKPEDAFLLCSDLMEFAQEHFIVFLLNTKNRVISRKVISVGGLNSAVVHPREVFRAAIESSTASILCVHNHPSGDPTPSREDISVTKRLVEAGKVIGIDVLDHVVVGRDGWVSLKQQGMM
ncbi:DNA repair protein RadC [Paenibacillus polymyxa]|uniref:JAB domain-containing protein n=1 Tax=Paenibacillus polymyxa TaxID=1406 RepID=UPI002AB4381E|nr:DNA repair protein RadC [Paenibacillus polymyxa]MDY7989852.1 DNA repair protein RadC [Paenibacillus polymyxa]MDY8116789.1 DNA repair protein RadC [Paenibacillus polymyxa]